MICLFVSFEVESKEIILSCQIEYEFINGKVDKNVEEKFKKVLKPFRMYLSYENKWIGEKPREYYETVELFREEEETRYIEKSNFDFDDEIINHFFSTKITFKDYDNKLVNTGYKFRIKLDRYNGVFTYEEKYYVGEKRLYELEYNGVCKDSLKENQRF